MHTHGYKRIIELTLDAVDLDSTAAFISVPVEQLVLGPALEPAPADADDNPWLGTHSFPQIKLVVG